MTHEEYQRAANYWKEKDADNVKMEREQLLAAMTEYIQANNTCTLATGTGEFVRCTPIEYTYYKNAFWMFSEGGEKFYALEQNKQVCLAIYDKYDGFGTLKGMQIMGDAHIIEPFAEEYVTIAQVKKIPIEALQKLAHPMNLIKVVPNHIDFLNSDFKKNGKSSRQSIQFPIDATSSR